MAAEATKREAGWLVALAEDQDDSLWLVTCRNDRTRTAFMRYLLMQYIQPVRGDWWLRP